MKAYGLRFLQHAVRHKNHVTDNEMHKSYLNPISIRNTFGTLTTLGQNLFSLEDDDTTSFVINFFDYSVRTAGFVQAYAIKLGGTGVELDKIAAEGLYKCVIGMRRLGVRVIQDNKDTFLTSCPSLFSKYHLEQSNSDGTVSKDLLSPKHIYNSWANVCTACLLTSGALDDNTQVKFEEDMHFAVEAGAPIIWYLKGKLDNNKFQWQLFVDKMLRRYWDRIPPEHLTTS